MTSTNLPVQLTTFIGRDRELAEVEHLLSTSRLVTLTGPGGSGKTRLAIQVANRVNETYPDGVWLADLASTNEPGLVPQLVALAFGLRLARDQAALEQLLDWVEPRRQLLILDNCEHLIDACTRLSRQLLSRAHELHVLATSREPLAIIGETVYPVSGLAWPVIDARFVDNPQDLLQFDAVKLLINRVRAVLPGFTITSENSLAIAEICQRLDGLPLALELASARSNVLTLQQIAGRLDNRFALLVSRARSDPEARHRTLRTAMDWSYDLLSPAEQVMLRRLAVFSAGFSLATAEIVCTGGEVEQAQVLDLLSSLANKSFVVANTLQGNEARYSLLETIRQYAQEKLAATGEWPVIRQRHLECFLQLAEDVAPKLSGAYQQLWLNWLEREYDNLRLALACALESQRIEAGLRVAIAIYQFWTIRDYVEEGLKWMERLLVQADERVTPVVHANALAYAAFLAGFRGNVQAQMGYGSEAARLAEAAGEEGRPALVWALSAQAYGARAAGDYATELDLGKRVIQLNRQAGNRYQLGLTLSITSFAAMALGEYAQAHAMLDEALPLLREVGNPYRVAMALNFSGDLARCEQNYPAAQAAYEESIALLRKLEAPRDLASVLHNLGHTRLHLGHPADARALFSESLTIQLAHRNTPGAAECLIGYAAMAVTGGQPAVGTRLLAAAVAIGGQRTVSAWAATRLEYEHYSTRARSELTAKEFQAEQAAGRSFSIAQAVEYAQSLALKFVTLPTSREKAGDLTRREREIVVLIARGQSNEQIADELVLSKRTVEKHIANIRAKLGVTQRTQIVRWAIEAGIVKTT